MIFRLTTWARKGGLAILDQALFAGTNFLINILIARWFEPEIYGAFVTAYSLFLLLGTFHSATIVEPMLIYGTGKFAKQFHRYLALLCYLHTGQAAVMSIIFSILALIAYFENSLILSKAFVGLAIIIPFLLLLWLLRRAFYIRSQIEWAVVGGILYLVILIGLLFVLSVSKQESLLSVLLIMGISALLVGVFLIRILNPEWKSLDSDLSLKYVIRSHWRYGRWSTGAALLTWVPSNIYYLFLTSFAGLSATGVLRAGMNLILPIFHINSALSVVLLPKFVRTLYREGNHKFDRDVKTCVAQFILGTLGYSIFLIVFGPKLLQILYASKYPELNSRLMLAVIGLLPILSGINNVLGAALRAKEEIKKVFWSTTGSSIVTLTVGLLLLVVFGINGAFAGLLLSYLTATIVLTFFQSRPIKEAQ